MDFVLSDEQKAITVTAKKFAETGYHRLLKKNSGSIRGQLLQLLTENLNIKTYSTFPFTAIFFPVSWTLINLTTLTGTHISAAFHTEGRTWIIFSIRFNLTRKKVL